MLSPAHLNLVVSSNSRLLVLAVAVVVVFVVVTALVILKTLLLHNIRIKSLPNRSTN